MTTDAPGNNPQQSFPGRAPRGPFAKVLTFVLSAAILVFAFMFSLVALAVAAVGGLLLGGWLWWKTRAVRKQMAAAQATAGFTRTEAFRGTIIEGEVIRDADAPPPPPGGRLLN